MLFYIKTSYKDPTVIILLFLGFVSPLRGQDVGFPTSFTSFRDYSYSCLISEPDSIEKIVYTHRNTPRQFLHELIWLELSRLTTSDRFGQDLETIRTLSTQQQSALGTAIYHLLKGRAIRPSNLSEAFEHFNQAFAFFERTKDTSGILFSECEYVKIHLEAAEQNKESIQTAKRHFDRATKLAQQSSFVNDKLLVLLKLIEYKKHFIDYPANEQEKDFKKLYQLLSTNVRFSNSLRAYYARYARFLSGISRHDEALQNALMALRYASNRSEYYKIKLYMTVGKEYYFLKNWQKAKTYYSKALAANRSGQHRRDEAIIDCYEALIKINIRLKRVENLEQLIAKRDSLKNAYNKNLGVNQLLELQKKYETEKKELTIKTLELENQAAQSKNRTLSIGLLGAAVLISITAFLLVKLRRSNAKLHTLQQARDKFYTTIAHDLRLPMNSLNDMGALLHHLINEGKKQELDKVIQQIENMRQQTHLLLNSLFEWGKSQYFINESATQPDIFDATVSLQTLCNHYLPFAEAKGVSLALALPSSLPLKADQKGFETAVRNLLDNALKHTPTGGKITVSGRRSEESTLHYSIMIADTGEGIAPEQLKYLQQVFLWKIKPEVGVKGLGLGMVLVYNFAKKNKIKLQIMSEPGVGSCFSIVWKP